MIKIFLSLRKNSCQRFTNFLRKLNVTYAFTEEETSRNGDKNCVEHFYICKIDSQSCSLLLFLYLSLSLSLFLNFGEIFLR